ncbi:MAG: hypothetical protein HHAS10_01630 [Candidatus Altimarinota bacterium]
MSFDTPQELTLGEMNAEIMRKLDTAFGGISDNVASAVISLPKSVREALLAAGDKDEVERVWNTYLHSVVDLMPKGDYGDLDEFRRNHGHRYTDSAAGILAQN